MESRTRRKMCYFYAAGIIFLVSGFFAGCSDEANSAPVLPDHKTIVTTRVQVEKAAVPITLTGLMEPVRRAVPAARIMAKTLRVNFKEGDRVEEGKLLLELDTRDLLAKKREAEAARDTASIALSIAQKNLKRISNLQRNGTVPRSKLENMEVTQSQANAGLAAANAALDELDVNLSYSVARAPFSGIIVRKMVEVGNMVAPGQPLFVIEDDSRLRVIASVGSDLAAGLKAGQSLPVRISGETVQGTVEAVVSSGSTEAPGLRVQLIIDNSRHSFKAGTLAMVEVPLAQSEVTRTLVSKEALIERGSLTGAFVVTNDKRVRLQWLIPGEDQGDTVSVLSGLHEGERVVLSPEKYDVKDGQSIEEITR